MKLKEIMKQIKVKKIKTDIGLIYVGLKLKYLIEDEYKFGIITSFRENIVYGNWYKTDLFYGKGEEQILFLEDFKKNVVEIYEVK